MVRDSKAQPQQKKAKELLRSEKEPKTPAEQMIVNNYTTIKNIEQVLHEPLTPKLPQHLQASITKDTMEGRREQTF